MYVFEYLLAHFCTSISMFVFVRASVYVLVTLCEREREVGGTLKEMSLDRHINFMGSRKIWSKMTINLF